MIKYLLHAAVYLSAVWYWLVRPTVEVYNWEGKVVDRYPAQSVKIKGLGIEFGIKFRKAIPGPYFSCQVHVPYARRVRFGPVDVGRGNEFHLTYLLSINQ